MVKGATPAPAMASANATLLDRIRYPSRGGHRNANSISHWESFQHRRAHSLLVEKRDRPQKGPRMLPVEHAVFRLSKYSHRAVLGSLRKRECEAQ